MGRRTTGTLWLLAALVAVLFPLLPSPSQRDLLQTGISFVALVIAWRSLLARPEIIRRGWGSIVLAVTVLGVSDAVAAVELDVIRLDLYPRPSNILALVGYFLLGVGVVQFERNRSRGRALPGGIEAAIFAFGAVVPLLVFLVVPVLQADRFSFASKSTVIAYAVADLAVMTVIARLMLTDGKQARSLVFLSAALFVSLLGDFWSGITTTQGPSSALAPIKMLWLASYILFAAGLAHPSLRALADGDTWQDDASSTRRVWLMGVGQAMPALTLAIAWLLGLPQYVVVIAVGGLVVQGLVSARITSLLDRIGEQAVQLAALARSDELTGLHNRRSWNHELSRACATAREEGHHLCVVLIDIDNFKAYNDAHGHPAGDRLLREAASVWAALLREGDILARYGGEEFAVVMPATHLNDALSVIDTMREATPGGQSFSAGVAVWAHGTDPAEAIGAADEALYRAKRSGRNQVLPATGADLALMPGSLQAMRPVVQPIVRAGDLAVVAYEALSRFPHSTNVPAVFAQAHDLGYGDLLEATAVTRALALPDRPDGVEMFVNVSERAMRSARFWELMPADLTGVVVELHEDRDGLEDAEVAAYLDRFHSRGARIALDDLGVRATDLTRIVTLAPDLMKIDRSLVDGCDSNAGQLEVIRLMVSFAHGHGVEVCAEGVETPGELEAVRSAGADLVQGYLLGRPEKHWVTPLTSADVAEAATDDVAGGAVIAEAFGRIS